MLLLRKNSSQGENNTLSLLAFCCIHSHIHQYANLIAFRKPAPSFSPTPLLLVLHWCCIDSSLLTLLICAGLLSHKYFKSMFSGFWKQPVSRKPVSSCVVQALRCAAFVALTSYMTGSAQLRPRPPSPDKVNCSLLFGLSFPELWEVSNQHGYLLL